MELAGYQLLTPKHLLILLVVLLVAFATKRLWSKLWRD
jgi:Sec-independent protein translocase protein TatA